MTTILFATDLHGNSRAYRTLFAGAARHDVDAVILGGDLLPHGGSARDSVEVQSRYLDEFLRAELTALRNASSSCAVFVILGNDDVVACTPMLEMLERDGLLVHVHAKAKTLSADWSVAGCSYVPITPFWMSDFDRLDSPGWTPALTKNTVWFSTADGLREGTLAELLARPTIEHELAALARRSDPRRTIYVVHTPPWGTALDQMAGGAPIGSRALRRFIEQEQPPLTLHGHIHESPSRSGRIHEELGNTLSINPGASHARLQAVLLDLDDPLGSLRRLDDTAPAP